MEFSEKDIWDRVKAGDQKAFEFIFNKYYSMLCLYSLEVTREEEVAKEIVSDVFLKLWQQRLTIEIRQSLKAYFFRCVYHSSVDYLRSGKSKIHQDSLKLTHEINQLVGVDEGYIIDKIDFREVDREVHDAIGHLPAQCREIFCLSRFEQKSYAEISKKLDISVNTVKTQIGRALDRLRIKLNVYL